MPHNRQPIQRKAENMTNSRMAVLRILESFDKQPWDLDRLIDKQLSKTPVDHRDRRFILEMIYGIVRMRLTLNHAIEHYVDDPQLFDNQHLRRLLQIGIYQLVFMDRVPDHAAVNETVACAHQDYRSKKMTGIVNGVLRSLIKEKKRVLFLDQQKDILTRLSIEYSHPQWMVSRWLCRIGLLKTKSLLAFNNEKPEIYLRRKIHGLSRQHFETESKEYLSAPCGYLNCFYRLTKPLQPDSLELFNEGHCTVQAPSSGWITALMDVHQGDRIIDICAAPGGKSELMGEMAGETGRIYACELKSVRMQLISDTMRRMRANNVVLVQCDGKRPPFSRGFASVLLDAPCSGTGVMHRHPEARWIKKTEDLLKLSQLQEKLLDAGAAMIAVGGKLVYSTCSLEPEENEQRIESFLASHQEFILEDPPETIPRKFVDAAGFVRITPYDHKLDGMFGALLKKIREKPAL